MPFLTRLLRSAAALTAVALAALAHPAFATPFGVIAAAMVAATIGYVFRRAVGNDRPPPVTLLEPGRKITGD